MELEKIRKIISDILKINENDIESDMSVTDDLGADSLEVCRIMAAVEELFDVEITPDDMKNIRTVRDAADYVIKSV
ncbi:MAG: acyl carrier protein [Lachnospiraceae bacterium]|nr:acyl carrier protein [Lachnospiraceae bacterium]